MKQLLVLTIFIGCQVSCKTNSETGVIYTEKAINKKPIQVLIPDTTNNRRARWDLDDSKFRSKIEKQIGLSDLQKGADSLEIRLWYHFSFSNSQELYVLKFQDTNCLLTYYSVYPRQINYDDENRNREWNPYTAPIIDSSVSKAVLLTEDSYRNLHSDSVWFLKSQSELNISDKIGFTDCDGYVIEIADRKHFKYLRHHCAIGYYEKTKLKEILDYLDFCGSITALANKYNAIVPYNYN